MMLQVVGVEPTSVNADGTGAYGLTLADQRLGRARFKANDNGGVWMVVLATPNIAVTLDPDAVLTAAFQPTPKVAGWGGQVATPMAPGGDGAPWGQPARRRRPEQSRQQHPPPRLRG